MCRIRKIGLPIVLLAFCLAACGQDEKEVPQDSGAAETPVIDAGEGETGEPKERRAEPAGGEKAPVEADVMFPKTYKKEFDHLVFDAEVVCPETASKGKVALPEIEVQELDEDKVVKHLLKDTTVSERTEHNAQGEDGSYSQYINYICDGLNMGYQKEGLDFITDFFLHVGSAFDLEDNPDQYRKEGQLDFLDLDTARKRVEEEIAALGIDLGEGLLGGSYALDYQTMEKEEEVLDMDGNPDLPEYKASWTKEDDCYYFYGWQTYAGIKVHYPNEEYINKMADFNAPVQAAYSKRGIEYLCLGKTFSFGQAGAQKDLLPFEEIVRIVTDKYGMLLTDTVDTVKRMELCYYPQKKENGKYEMTCIWTVTFARRDEDSGEHQMGIDAFTGEEIYQP